MSERFSRQSFLGDDAQDIIERARVAIVGLGGGGSHLAQQLAHLGFHGYRIFDGDVVEESNLNRLVGATLADAQASTPKVVVAERLIRGLVPDADVVGIRSRWQDQGADELAACDLVFGCVDGFSEREQIERTARRYVLPYIDIGLDVHRADGEAPVMAGQVIASVPGSPCMRCLGFLTEKKLAGEAARYGDAGHRPQVVWANGVLASIAVGIAVEMLTGWTGRNQGPIYLQYDANGPSLAPHVRAHHAPVRCEHYPLSDAGPVKYSPA